MNRICGMERQMMIPRVIKIGAAVKNEHDWWEAVYQRVFDCGAESADAKNYADIALAELRKIQAEDAERGEP